MRTEDVERDLCEARGAYQVKIADDKVYGQLRADICDEWIASGSVTPKENWLYSRLVESRAELTTLRADLASITKENEASKLTIKVAWGECDALRAHLVNTHKLYESEVEENATLRASLEQAQAKYDELHDARFAEARKVDALRAELEQVRGATAKECAEIAWDASTNWDAKAEILKKFGIEDEPCPK